MAHIEALPLVLHKQFGDLIAEIQALGLRIAQLDKSITTIAREDAIAPLLMSIPGIGVTTATALIAGVADIHLFKRARQFSAWLGVTLKEHGSGKNDDWGPFPSWGIFTTAVCTFQPDVSSRLVRNNAWCTCILSCAVLLTSQLPIIL